MSLVTVFGWQMSFSVNSMYLMIALISRLKGLAGRENQGKEGRWITEQKADGTGRSFVRYFDSE